MKKSYLILILNLLLLNFAFATPSEIIIVRHADKLKQPNPGPTLSAKGEARAIRFGFYFLKKFGEPDFIIATEPYNNTGKDSSIRELQTVAPLANMLAERYPKKGFPILHPYSSSEYTKLADYVLTDKKFSGKKVLICWNHKLIPQLANALGVPGDLSKWPTNDFDSVYVLQYNKDSELENFSILNQQYPVRKGKTWHQIKKSQQKI